MGHRGVVRVGSRDRDEGKKSEESGRLDESEGACQIGTQRADVGRGGGEKPKLGGLVGVRSLTKSSDRT